ncbi:relaxase/mobilization nuclease domain-containing protein [Pedobacter sp. ISL-68]|uniref:relaxase/mobilization nuclease domain-containing protein n=1 Tax=unclassified Pedobacter TaxID=2628915 RepID=UPI001BEC88DC|nr:MULTISPECIES: relaxase/mobilization nuclease domain-containing protein [unclassified Pedobacter]MBT2561339.1 relaxase/mobilization nuclease domain-containing protein [Pedobacter sp. ISL-64]MBT2590728.1 relaxase/mobilization nuclease domain-containing protein [Pedobacter sp. ISL-68]
MVAVIRPSGNIRKVLNYNEHKVKEGVATCLEAAYYLKDVDKLTFTDKLRRLQNLAELRESTKVNTLHISLNFDPSEHHSPEKLKEISASYLEKIGFGGQPYLLYQHFDAGHPHVHILTTNIKPDGKAINLHNIGKNQSEKARKEIEIAFGLVKAEDSEQRKRYDINPVNAAVEYGRSATKRAITNVLNHVLSTYKFSSLPELNAVLNRYNVSAERGTEQSRVYRSGGLLYRIRTPDGTMKGVPIKASDFYNKPTLKHLEQKFIEHSKEKPKHKIRVKNTIDLFFARNPGSNLQQMILGLHREGMDAIVRQNKDGIVYGITYVDHTTKCVFNGSDLGKSYSAKGILERCGSLVPIQDTPAHSLSADKQGSQENGQQNDKHPSEINHEQQSWQPPQTTVLEELLQYENASAYLPYELSGKKKKRKNSIKR